MLTIYLSLPLLRLRPDRTPHPGLGEFKKVGQPFAVEIVSATGVILDSDSGVCCRVDLWIHFSNRFEHVEDLLDVLKFDWVAEVNGETVCEGYDLGGGGGVCEVNEEIERRGRWPDVLITFHIAPISPCSDLVVRITACLRHNVNWASCGHPVGFEELLLRPQIVPEAYYTRNLNNTAAAATRHDIPPSSLWPPGQRANVVENHHNGMLVLSAGPLEVSFHKSSGGLAGIRLSDHDLLYAAPADNNDFLSPLLSVQLLRAPTDNDRGGYVDQWNAVGLSLSNPLQPVGKPSLAWWLCDGGASAVLTVRQDWEPTDEDTEKIQILKRMSHLNIPTSAENIQVAHSGNLRPPPLILKDLTPSEMKFVLELIKSWRLGFQFESNNCIKVWVKDRVLNSTVELEEDVVDIAGIQYFLSSLTTVPPHIDDDNTGVVGSVAVPTQVSHPQRMLVRNRQHIPTSIRVKIETEYHLNAKRGVLCISCKVETPTWWPPLPRVGLRLLLGDKYEAVEWFGRGPDECYPDRRSAAYTGLC